MALKYPPATLLRRLSAAVYDSLLLVGLWMACTFPLLLLNRGEAVSSDSWWYPLYLLAITGGFHVWFWSHGGQTLGMRAWRLWAVDEAGETLSTGTAIRRYIISTVSWISILGLLWSLIDSRGRTAHDLISHTDIIHIPK